MSAVIAPPAEHELPVHWAVAEPDNTQRRGVLGGVRLRIDTVCLVMVCMILIAVAFLAMMIVAIVKDWTQPASYSVAIDSVAGLDPETDLPRDTLNPEFNLTLRLASQRADMGVCFEAGTTVAVYYGGVLLAGAAVPALCAGPRPSAEEESVVAWGRGVPVPRLARDRLAGDLRGGGAAEFDVTLTVQRYTYAESWDVVLCSGKVGDAAALITPCSLYDENVQEPSLEPGYGGPPRPRGLSVAVAIVSGLDPATDLARPAVDPQFNLTLRVASRSLLSRACVGVSSTAVAVSYHGVRLASAPVAPRVCAARRKSADAGPFVAWGSSVRLPGVRAGQPRRGHEERRGGVRRRAHGRAPGGVQGQAGRGRGRLAGSVRLDPRGNGCGGAAHGNVKRLAKYYVAIDTASGLDPATDLPWPVLTPEFNLTLRVTSWSVVGAACLDPAMDVAVAYRGLALARASPPPRVCARGWGRTEQVPVVASSGNGVRLPGFALHGLEADAWGGAVAFDVALTMPPKGRDNRHQLWCRAVPVGDDGGLGIPCNANSEY
ncbi:hypothetical protein OsJ_07554 [Oryza sativa Japonica Group]|uniref:Late embryogenesis abundant protein LEA-2 subgroup domain-containing protein n=1 Tax=Oryza sativa subsp. japonica TaxID=39947 RepID=A3A948_ORYSJ|nr:hypothetical protein OsJ_07554 [Oryza sativa Japonica Group]